MLRYIGYYARLLRSPTPYTPVKLYLRSVVLKPVPHFGGSNEFYLQVGISFLWAVVVQ